MVVLTVPGIKVHRRERPEVPHRRRCSVEAGAWEAEGDLAVELRGVAPVGEAPVAVAAPEVVTVRMRQQHRLVPI